MTEDERISMTELWARFGMAVDECAQSLARFAKRLNSIHRGDRFYINTWQPKRRGAVRVRDVVWYLGDE